MSRKLLTLLLGLPLVFSVRDLLAKDTKVALHLVNGKQIVGLLHSVSDSSIKVLVYVGVGESAREVKHGEIRSIEVISRPKLLVFLKNGQHISGELGAVTDSLLALQKTKILVQSNNESAHDQSQAEIAVHEIQEVVIQGSPNIGRGMGRGALIGTLTGVAIGALAESSSNEDPFVGAGGIALFGGIAGGLTGLGIGALIGAFPTGEQKVGFLPSEPFGVLKPLGRFPHGERK